MVPGRMQECRSTACASSSGVLWDEWHFYWYLGVSLAVLLRHGLWVPGLALVHV